MFKRVSVVSVLIVLLIGSLPVTTGQDEPTITVDLTLYEGNPVLPMGAEGTWDSMVVSEPRVIYHDGLFHMFFYGGDIPEAPTGVGYATSPDGMVWTEYEGNPVFTPEMAGSPGIRSELTYFDGEQWVMLFNPGESFDAPGDYYLRATAPAPTGPWTAELDPVLAAGSETEWDAGPFSVESIVSTEEGYILYYGPFNSPTFGMATSADGMTWTKYDNPETVDSPYADSDPIFTIDDAGMWAQSWIGAPVVRHHSKGYDMFFTGTTDFATSGIGYAYSDDGITWMGLHEDGAVVEAVNLAVVSSVLEVEGTFFLYYVEWDLMVGGPNGIGVVTGTVTWETEAEIAAEFPTGTFTTSYQGMELREIFDADGSFTFSAGGMVMGRGTYRIEGNQLIWETYAQCSGKAATYTWTYEDNHLTLIAVGGDACAARRDPLNGRSYRFVG
jgi:hypothetical protein